MPTSASPSVYVLIASFAVLLVGCDRGPTNSCPLTGQTPSFTVNFGAPLNTSFSADNAYQAELDIEGGRYAQLLVATADADTTAVFLGYGPQQSMLLDPGTYDVVSAERADTSDTPHEGFVGYYRSEQLASLGATLDGSVQLTDQCGGLARGSFRQTAMATIQTNQSTQTDSVTISGSFTVQQDNDAVRAFLPFDRIVAIDSSDV